MRWVASLFALGLMMALFHRLTATAPLEARATLALGFLVITAQLGGDLAQRVRLGRLTGFLLAGLAVGPAWLGLVRADEIGALQFVADGVVALIAFAVGAELKIDALRRDGGALVRVSAAAIAAPFLAVTLVTLSVGRWFPLTVHQPPGDVLAVALVLGTIATAGSPAFTLGVMDELHARGPAARMLLSVTVVKEVAVVVLFALALTAGRFLASAGALNSAVAWSALVGLAGSLAAGVALGYVVAQYLKVARRDGALLLVAVAVGTAQVARLLGLEPLLMGLAGGCYVANYARVEGERLVTALARGSGPMYLVFFALAGAGIGGAGGGGAGARDEVPWAWVLLLVGLRAVGLYYGMLWAGVTPVLARAGWLGLISQGGVAFGLAAAARRAFPEWGVSLETLVVAMFGVHEVFGPIGLRRALRLAGEVTEGEHVTDGMAVGVSGESRVPVGRSGLH